MKNTAENLRDAEDEMPEGNFLEDIAAQRAPELHNAILMTVGTDLSSKMPAFS